MTLYACFAHSSGLSKPLWFNRVPAAGEDEVDVWDCGSDLVRLKCRKCPNHFVDSTPICPLPRPHNPNQQAGDPHGAHF